MEIDRTTLDPYRLRAIRTGSHASALALFALLVFRLLPGGDSISTPVFVIAWTLIALGTVVATRLPWPRLIASGREMLPLYLWSIFDIVIITWVAADAGPETPSVFVLYALTTIFFATTYPLKSQIGLFGLTAGCYLLAASITDLGTHAADHFLRLSLLGIVAFMASFLSRELMRQLTAHSDARSGIEQRFEDLQRADELFRAVSELASDYVYSMAVQEDGSLEWEWVSDAYERVTGYTPEESTAAGGWPALLHQDDLPVATESFRRLLAGERSISELRLKTKSGDLRHLRMYADPVWDDQHSRVVRILGAVQDVTERRRDEQTVQESNSLLRATLESTADGILVVNKRGRIVVFNQRFVDMWRIPREVVESRDDRKALEVVKDQLVDPSVFEDKVRSLYANDKDESFDVLEFKDGRTYERYSQPQKVGGEVVGRVWSFRDVSDERRSEQKIRATLEALRKADQERRRLLAHLVRAKEEERTRVAAGIHDDSVQIMASVAIDLERISPHLKDPELRATLTRIEDSVRAAINRLRSMVFELRPPALDSEGLGPALTLYLEELQLDSGLEYELVNSLEAEPSDQLRVVIYRIAQEALNNVRKHAQARSVRVELLPSDGGITLRITDDGHGFRPDLMSATIPGHIGIMEMRERAEIVGGKLDLYPRPSSGTVVEAWVPQDEGGIIADGKSA